jgi:transposase-like protein
MEAPGRRRRRKHSEEFKASVIRACRQPGVSMASVALANGLNATMLRKWVVQAEQGAGAPRSSSTAMAQAEAKPAFVQMSLPQPAASGDIRIEVQRGALRVAVSWPAGAAAQCTAWLRELLR